MGVEVMPTRSPGVCVLPGCPEVAGRGRYCLTHAKAHSKQQDAQRESANARGYDARWQRIRANYLQSHPICVDPYRRHVGRVVPATDVDHIVAKKDGGSNIVSNLQPLCHPCHSHKTVVMDGGFTHG